MSILRGFLPFILFWILGRQVSLPVALWVPAGVALFQIGRSARDPSGGSLKLLDVCGTVLFVVLAAFVTFADPAVSPFPIHLAINGGLALIAIGSMLVRRPFTLQYAREQVPPEFWNSPVFIKTNYRITGVWSAAFVVQALASVAEFTVAGLPEAVPLAISVLALVGALGFTIEYPKRVRARAASA